MNGPEKLLKVVKNPVTDHLPPNTIKIGECPFSFVLVWVWAERAAAMSGDAATVRLSQYVRALPETHHVAIFVGAMARGRDDFADGVADEKISISNYPLSASVACGKVGVQCASIFPSLPRSPFDSTFSIPFMVSLVVRRPP